MGIYYVSNVESFETLVDERIVGSFLYGVTTIRGNENVSDRIGARYATRSYGGIKGRTPVATGKGAKGVYAKTCSC